MSTKKKLTILTKLTCGFLQCVNLFQDKTTKSRQGLLPALIFGLVGQMSVTSLLRLGWCRSCRRGGSAPRRCGGFWSSSAQLLCCRFL